MSTSTEQKTERKGSQRFFTMIWFFWVLGLLAISSSSVHESIQSSLTDPVFFKTRETLGKTPPLSPRLKIFALDDGTVGYLGGPDLATKDLTLLLANIAKQKPRAILLDRLFALTPPGAEAEHFLKELGKLHVPVYSGASIVPALKFRDPTQLAEADYGMARFSGADTEKNMPFIQHALHNSNGLIYGYDKGFQDVFRGVGHIMFDRVGSVYPAVVIKDKILPHLSLFAAESIAIKDEQLLVNNLPVPLSEKGAVVINHRPLMDLYKKIQPMQNAIRRARADQRETWVNEGDAVVILFNFYTGSTDFVESAPFGNLAGGLLVSTLVDSVLENRWVTPTSNMTCLILILIMSAIGVVLAKQTGSVVFWLLTLLISAIYFAFSIYLFAYQDFVFPWVLPLLGLMGGGTIQYVKQRLGSEMKAVAMENQFLIERALRLEEEKTNLQLAERLNLGRAVQQILLPPLGKQDHGHFTFDMSYIPAQEMSGDWVYVWGKGTEERRVIIGDVVGKGPSAAIPVAILIGILGECEKGHMEVEETLHYLNKRIIDLFGKQITCSCSVIVLKGTMEIELYNAGSPGWFYRGEGKARHIAMRSTSLGMNEEAYFAKEKLQLTPGSFLFAFTDGYMEGARAFRRLINRLDTMQKAPSFIGLQTMLDEIGLAFRLEDDRSLLMIRTKGQEDESPKTLFSIDSDVA